MCCSPKHSVSYSESLSKTQHANHWPMCFLFCFFLYIDSYFSACLYGTKIHQVGYARNLLVILTPFFLSLHSQSTTQPSHFKCSKYVLLIFFLSPLDFILTSISFFFQINSLQYSQWLNLPHSYKVIIQRSLQYTNIMKTFFYKKFVNILP